MSLLERIKELREKNGNISINKLEKEAGLTRGSMSKWNNHVPSSEKLKKVADYFGVSVGYLLAGETDIKNQPALGKSEPEDEVTRELFDIVLGADDEERAAILEVARLMKKRRPRDGQ